MSSLQTSFLPSQQFCDALILPPSGSTGAPQMLPVPLHDWPLSQRSVPLSQMTEPLGLMPPPQHSSLAVQNSPVSRQPPAIWQTAAPLPRSTQTREQQFVPPFGQGLPPWMQPPPPPPVMNWQRPTPPDSAEQACPQQSESARQTSPFAWQL